MLRVGSVLQICLLGLVALGLTAGCGIMKREPTPAALVAEVEPETPQVWVLQFSDDFERAELGPDWQVVSGDWAIRDGMLVGGTPGQITDNTIICTRKFPGAQRLEFKGVSDNPCDLTGLLCMNEGGYLTSYFFGFGSEENICSKILVEGIEVARTDTVITPGKVYHIVCQSQDGRLTLLIDNEVILDYTEKMPLEGANHQQIGLNIWTTGRIDDLKVYTRLEDAPPKP